MNFEVTHVSRGDIRLKSEDKHVRVLGEALVALAPNEPGYVIYLNSLNKWEVPPNVTLTETEKRDVVSAIRKHFQDCGSVIEFE
ncbi:Imm74 family immunity protein [Massilia sp. S19_KUP03_FR1]|uniref:Imm74 family immunity protein n=1 Tax=Massilia sp. S19_KUP03_FR1 TaxID=3025503 RepID=UPI003FA60E99